MLDPEFRCRETTDPPHGYRPVWPPRPPTPPPSWWDRLWRRLSGLLASSAPVRHADRRRARRLAGYAVGSLHAADVARILDEAADRDPGEEP